MYRDVGFVGELAVTDSECGFCKKYRNRHNITVGGLVIIRRSIWRSQPKTEGGHLHICISSRDFAKDGKRASVIFLVVVSGLLIGFGVAAHGDFHLVTIALALIAFVNSAIVFLYVNLIGNSQPSYGALLSLLSKAGGPSEGIGSRKNVLLDASLELYCIDGCGSAAFLELLKWINCKDRRKRDFKEFANKLITLLYKDNSKGILRRICKVLLWIWT
jgi:hypothetical protein